MSCPRFAEAEPPVAGVSASHGGDDDNRRPIDSGQTARDGARRGVGGPIAVEKVVEHALRQEARSTWAHRCVRSAFTFARMARRPAAELMSTRSRYAVALVSTLQRATRWYRPPAPAAWCFRERAAGEAPLPARAYPENSVDSEVMTMSERKVEIEIPKMFRTRTN